MAQKTSRFFKKEDFLKVARRGIYVKGNFLSIKAMANGLPYPRMGFIVGQKVSKKATRRNLTKRRLRAGAQEILLHSRMGYDVVFMPSADIAEKSFAEIKDEIETVLKKARII